MARIHSQSPRQGAPIPPTPGIFCCCILLYLLLFTWPMSTLPDRCFNCLVVAFVVGRKCHPEKRRRRLCFSVEQPTLQWNLLLQNKPRVLSYIIWLHSSSFSDWASFLAWTCVVGRKMINIRLTSLEWTIKILGGSKDVQLYRSFLHRCPANPPDKSWQSSSPSQRQPSGMQWPLPVQRNWLGLHEISETRHNWSYI